MIINRDLREDPVSVFKKISEFLGVDPGFWDTVDLKRKYNVGRSPRSWLIHRVGLKIASIVGFDSFVGTTIRRHILRRFNTRIGYPPMNPSVRKELVGYFKDYNKRLEAFLGRNLPWWYE